MNQPTYVELFAGAGGLSLGLDRAGWRCLGHAEIEPHARAILRYRWPDTPLYGDVATLDGTKWRGITLLSGGSPCQDLSIAGKREGLTGRRSGLFFHQVRLWRESEAPLLLWENVVGALSSNAGKDFARILSTILGEPVAVPRDGQRRRAKWATAGYVAGTRGVTLAWRVLDLRRFNVPQRRRRVFIVAARGGGVCPRDVLSLTEGLSGHSDAGQAAWQADPGAAQVESGVGGAYSIAENQQAEVRLSDAIQALANGGGKPGQGYAAVLDTRGAGTGGANCLTPWDSESKRVYLDKGEWPALYAGERGGQNQQSVFALDIYNLAVNPDAVATISGAAADINHTHGVLDTREPLTFKVREGCEGGGKGYLGAEGEAFTLGTSPGQYVFDARGNGDGQTCNTLAGDHQNRVTDYTAIVALPRPRRLMPVETERLMSWPDDWTAIGIDEQGREYRLKDTPRYKACGNGVASVVAEWIGRRILLAMAPAQLQEAA